MARPRIFISSTFFDLRHVRSDIDRFITEMGYDPIRNEQGNIPYGKEEKLEEYCYKEISHVDILISIIGGRFGSASTHDDHSVSQMEIATALKLEKQVFIFIDKNVYSEYQTYLNNKSVKGIKYNYVDNIKIYEFIEKLEGLQKNNPIKSFESSEEIIFFLKEQWAGLFQRFLQEQRRIKEINLIQGIENTANSLNQLINYLTDVNKDNQEAIRDILTSNHPAFELLKKLTGNGYRVFFLTRDELTAWLKAKSYARVEEKNWDNPEIEEYYKNQGTKQYLIKVSSSLFDDSGNLKPIKKDEWNDDLIQLEVRIIEPDDDDLPF